MWQMLSIEERNCEPL